MGRKSNTGVAAIVVTGTAFLCIILAFSTPYWLVNDGLITDASFEKIGGSLKHSNVLV